jgi:hypothetical protein
MGKFGNFDNPEEPCAIVREGWTVEPTKTAESD